MKYLSCLLLLCFVSWSCTKTEQHINTVTNTYTNNIDTAKLKTLVFAGTVYEANGTTHQDQITATRNYIDQVITYHGAGLNFLFPGPDVKYYSDGSTQFSQPGDSALSVRTGGRLFFSGKRK